MGYYILPCIKVVKIKFNWCSCLMVTGGEVYNQNLPSGQRRTVEGIRRNNTSGKVPQSSQPANKLLPVFMASGRLESGSILLFSEVLQWSPDAALIGPACRSRASMYAFSGARTCRLPENYENVLGR